MFVDLPLLFQLGRDLELKDKMKGLWGIYKWNCLLVMNAWGIFAASYA
jgi:hypothetical protein